MHDEILRILAQEDMKQVVGACVARGPSILEPLLAYARVGDERLAARAVICVEQMAPSAAHLLSVMDVLLNGPINVSALAAQVLAKMPVGDLTTLVANACEGRDEPQQARLIHALAEAGDVSAEEFLLGKLLSAKEDVLARAAAFGLAAVRSSRAIPEMARRLRASSEWSTRLWFARCIAAVVALDQPRDEFGIQSLLAVIEG